MTPEERHLWYEFSRDYDIKVYRQRIIGNYIADFYCAQVKLVIELDGSRHYDEDKQKYDGIRTAYFNTMGIEVIRFSNNDCNSKFDEVCVLIDKEISSRRRRK